MLGVLMEPLGDRNLTLARIAVNREDKWAHELARWQPILNACWLTGHIVAVRAD